MAGVGVFRCAACGALNRVPDERLGSRPVCGACKARLDPSGAPQPVSGDALARTVASSPIPVLVDFWAEWCGPCRMAAPILAELATTSRGKVLVLKVNVDEERGAAGAHRIQGIPAFVLFQGGREVGRREGLASRADLEAWIGRTVRRAA
jgi:thioredoxin 2